MVFEDKIKKLEEKVGVLSLTIETKKNLIKEIISLAQDLMPSLGETLAKYIYLIQFN